MKFPSVMSSHMYGDPADILEAKQISEQRQADKKARQRDEAMADIASIYKRPKPTVQPQPRQHKPLDEFLEEEAKPKGWSPARQRAEELFRKD